METKKNHLQFKYDPEADVLSWEIVDAPIAYASEMGDMIVHFTKNHEPVYIEVLRAKDFMKTAEGVVGMKRLHPELVAA